MDSKQNPPAPPGQRAPNPAGSNNANGVYGTLGSSAAANIPGARYGSHPWTDAAGNMWLFGGYGYDSAGTANQLNDLWEY